MRLSGFRRFMRLDRGTSGVRRAVDDELQFHFDMTVAELRAAGYDADHARREAERRFGDLRQTRARLETIDRARAAHERRSEWFSALAQDVRYALRGMRLRPGFAAAVIVTLGLGIGANATMFGIVDRLLFRTPRYLEAPARTHKLYFNRTADGVDRLEDSESYARFLDVARESRAMDDVVAYSPFIGAVGDGDAAREVTTVAASAGLWRLFDARPVLGRFFDDSDDRHNTTARVAVLSYEFWQSAFRGSPAVLGQTVHIYRNRHTIIGVAPPRFTGLTPDAPVAFIPLAPHIDDGFGPSWNTSLDRYDATTLAIYARRRPHVSLDAANADLTEAYRRSYAAQVAVEPPAPRMRTDRPRAVAGSVIDQRGPRLSSSARIATWLLGVSVIVLLVACANVGNLLLGRAIARRREIAVRLALGISRRRLIVQLFIESGLLALFGGVAGLAIAQWGGALVRHALLDELPTDGAIVDARTLAFTAGIAVASGLIAGLAPIVHANRADIAAVLQASGQRSGASGTRTRSTLVVVQAALCVVLLVGAGLFVRSVVHLRATPLGYDPDALLWIQPRLRGETLDSLHRAAMRANLLERALHNPSVVNASRVVTVPFYLTSSEKVFVSASGAPKQLTTAMPQVASPGYFATVGTRLIRGRAFDARDNASAPLVAIVSRQFARAAWDGVDPIGQCLRIGADSMPCRRVIGVADDVHMIGNLAGDPDVMYYLPSDQFDRGGSSLLLRVRDGVSRHADEIRRDLQRAMPGSAYLVATPISETMGPVVRSWRLGATMFVVFGGLALVLATIGLYSVVAYGVAQRMHELGVRVALGARAADIMSLVIADGLRLLGIGVVLGLAAALLGGRWIAPLLFKVSATDLVTLGSVAATMLAVGAVASGVPARRAAHIDPALALRRE